MKRIMSLWVAAIIVEGVAVKANAFFDRDIAIVQTDKLDLNVWGRGQLLGVGQYVPDPIANHQRLYLFLKESRLGIDGSYADLFKYQMELAWGGEDANGSNTDLSLMDLVADVPVKPLGENTIVKIGQFRVPYSREGLGDEGYQPFADRSIANLATYQGRDYGLAIMGTKGNFTGTLGTFSGGGRDVPQRYIPEQIGVPEFVARVGYNDGIDEDIYHVVGTNLNLKRDAKAVYLNGLFMQDTRIGHSTAIGVRTTDKNVLVDSNFNPYINRGDLNLNSPTKSAICSAVTCERGHIFFLGGDGAYRHPLGGGKTLEGELEANWGGYWNRFGVLHIASGRAQGDYQVGKWEIGARYAILSMDSNAGFLSTTINPANGQVVPGTTGAGFTKTDYYNAGMGSAIHEVTPSLTYHFRDHSMKVVMDLPIYLNCPIWLDQVDGAYAFPDPTSIDQDTVLTNVTGGSTFRRTVVNARAEFQFQF